MIQKKFKLLPLYASLVAILTLSWSPFAGAAESVLLPTDDLYGMEQNPGTVKNETELKVTSHTGGKNKRTFLKYDLSAIPEACTIDGARLELYLLTAPGTSRTNDLYFVGDDSWTETSLTWSNQPVPSGLLATANTGTTDNTVISWVGTLSGQVATEYAGDKTLSLLLKDAAESNSPGAKEASYASEEHLTSPKPMLKVSYTCGAFEGCSHGFWKNTDTWPSSYYPNDLLTLYFSNIPTALAGDDLATALSYGGGPDFVAAARILLRNAVASLLNAADPQVNFTWTEAEVITAVDNALASGVRSTVLDLEAELDNLNNLHCPLEN